MDDDYILTVDHRKAIYAGMRAAALRIIKEKKIPVKLDGRCVFGFDEHSEQLGLLVLRGVE
jgi:hypothetical protein